MRLSEYERISIREAVTNFIPDAKILLYGSRTDDAKRGGDIDILILTPGEVDLRTRLKMEARMWEKIGEQKIDILIEKPDALSRFGRIVMPKAIPI
ncbi:MAG: nucleotidyltransferase domain-containing protein [Candidatus Kapaibacterium sp.]